jgi:AcrR family transcriptional regulator
LNRERAGISPSRQQTEQAFLDAAERLLLREGYATITTRKLATEADANHGLVHYYFGSMEELLLRVLERFTDRILTRQRAMYADPAAPFIEKWRKAMDYIDEDLASGYPKIWYELMAMGWNNPDFRDRLTHVHEQWDAVLTDAVTTAMREYGVDRKRFPPGAVAVLVRTFNEGILMERLIGYDKGHAALLKMIDDLLRRWQKESKQ